MSLALKQNMGLVVSWAAKTAAMLHAQDKGDMEYAISIKKTIPKASLAAARKAYKVLQRHGLEYEVSEFLSFAVDDAPWIPEALEFLEETNSPHPHIY